MNEFYVCFRFSFSLTASTLPCRMPASIRNITVKYIPTPDTDDGGRGKGRGRMKAHKKRKKIEEENFIKHTKKTFAM